MPMHSVPAVIIAAGSSSRLGRPKQLVMLQGETLLERAIRIAHEGGAAPVFVVLGAHLSEIKSRVEISSSEIVVNQNWQEGMASSIRAGVEALAEGAPDSAGVLLMICDQPSVTTGHLRGMLAAFRQNPACTIASGYAGRRGIPALFPRSSYVDLLSLRGDQGARGLLFKPGASVLDVPLEGGEIDIDLPEDLTRARSH